jgi:hypothetical protein
MRRDTITKTARVNDTTARVYITLYDDHQDPALDISEHDVFARVSKNGDPQTFETFTALTWAELDPLDIPGVYVITLPAPWLDTVGTVFIRVDPVAAPPQTVQGVDLIVEVHPLDLTDLDLQMKRVLGLCQENYRVTGQTYNPRGDLISAILSIYENAADTTADMNPIATYRVSASYDGTGRLIEYVVTRD